MILTCIMILLALIGVFMLCALLGRLRRSHAAILISIAVAIILALGAVKLLDAYEGRSDFSDPVDAVIKESERSFDSTDTQTADQTDTTSFDTVGSGTSDAAVEESGTDTAYTEKPSPSVTSVDTEAVTSEPAVETETSSQPLPPETDTVPEESTAVPHATDTVPEESTTLPPVTDTLPPAPETEPVSETEPVPDTAEPEPEPTPDYAAMAREAFCKITDSAAAYVQMTPRGSSFETVPFSRRDYCSELTEEQKAYYEELHAAVSARSNMVWRAADGHVLDDIRAAADALAAMRPDMQCYFTLAEIEEGKQIGALEICYFLPSDGTDVTYSDKSAIDADMAYFEAVCDYIVESMPENITAYDKYRYFASVITLTTKYDMDYKYPYNNATAYGGILGGHTICRGYAIAFEYLCARADMYCGRVEGAAFNNNVHMWNIAALDTGTYHIDVTWSDSGANKPCDSAWMKYFMITQEQVLRDHIISDGTVATGT